MTGMLRLGNIPIDQPFYQAGLAGYSDAAMRLVARRHGCPYCITEAMLDQFLIAGGKGLAAAELDERDHPIAGQLMGSHPAEIAQAARILIGLGYDVVDINLACPVKKIRKRARGGHLLSVPDEACDILDAVADAVQGDVPLTVKLRRSYDDTPEMEAAFHIVMKRAIERGYAGVTVHGRTVEQKYLGPAKWPKLRSIADQYAHEEGFALGGSGDIWTARDIPGMLEETGVHWVSVARGCIGNPWIFTQARALFAGDAASADTPPTIEQQRDVLLEHFTLSMSLHGEDQAGRMMRKFGIKFSVHHPDADAVKAAFILVKTLDAWRAVLADHYDRPSAPQRTESLAA